MDIPVLETPRLRLHGHTASDLEDCAAMWADPLTTLHIGGKPFTREDSWLRLLRYVGHWTLLGFGYWVIRDKATGAFIGEAGLANYERSLDTPLNDCPEAGWALSPAAQGKGFATEALQAITAWSDNHFNGSKTICIINPANQPSVRVAEKCGYRPVTTVAYKGNPIVLFSRDSADGK